MRKLTGALFATLVSVFAILLVASSAQAYPAPGVVVKVNHSTIVSGKTLVVNAHASVTCEWSATFNGQTITGTGTHFQAKFTAPTVQHKTTYTLTTVCDTATQAGHAGNALMPHLQKVTRTTQITVLPVGALAGGAAGGSALPNTGGPNGMLIGGALALILAGGGTLLVARRRRTASV